MTDIRYEQVSNSLPNNYWFAANLVGLATIHVSMFFCFFKFRATYFFLYVIFVINETYRRSVLHEFFISTNYLKRKRKITVAK